MLFIYPSIYFSINTHLTDTHFCPVYGTSSSTIVLLQFFSSANFAISSSYSLLLQILSRNRISSSFSLMLKSLRLSFRFSKSCSHSTMCHSFTPACQLVLLSPFHPLFLMFSQFPPFDVISAIFYSSLSIGKY